MDWYDRSGHSSAEEYMYTCSAVTTDISGADLQCRKKKT